MPLLSTSELAALRADILDLLPDTCRIERPTYVNVAGDVTETWGTATASVECRFDPDRLRREQETVAEREAGVARYIVTLPYDADVQDGDRLYFDGEYYQIFQLHNQHSMNGSVRCRVTRVEGE